MIRVVTATGRRTTLTTAVAGLLLLLSAQHAGGQESRRYAYSVSSLAPPSSLVPPIVLEDADLHAFLVEMAAGATQAQVGRRLGLTPEDYTRLVGLAEVEGLGVQTSEGWRPRALALTSTSVDTLRRLAAPLSKAIADTVAARWALLDSLVRALPVAGALPLSQTGYVLLGDFLLGRFQAARFWEAGLAPDGRAYAFRVYRIDPGSGPAGHLNGRPYPDGWLLTRYSSDPEPFGFAALTDPADPAIAGLLREGSLEEAADLAEELRSAYRLWYLMGAPPDPVALRLLQRLEVVDDDGRRRVPLISMRDLEQMSAIADLLGQALWPELRRMLPEIGQGAVRLGYDDPALLGETALWVWDLAVDGAMHDLIRRGTMLPPPGGRGQALIVPHRER